MSVSPFIAKLFSEVPENTIPFGFQGKNIKSVTGNGSEIRWRGDLPTPVAVTTQTAASSNNLGDSYGSAEFPLTHYALNFQIGVEQLTYIDGDESKTASFIDDEIERLIDGFFVKVSTDFHGTGDQDKANVGSWRRAIDVGESVGSYLGILRADALNINLRGNVDSAGGALTLARIQAMKTKVAAKKGVVDLGLLGEANYTVLQGLVDSVPLHNGSSDDYITKWGGEYIQIGRTKFALDGYCHAQNVGLFDTRFWTCQMHKSGFTTGAMVPDVTKVSVNVIPAHLHIAIVCESPRTQGRIVTA